MDLPLDLAADFPLDDEMGEPSANTLAAGDVYASLRHRELSGADGSAILGHALRGDLRGRIAIVSSFGAESALLLSVVAEIDRTVPVIFLQTGKHFPETLAYREALAERLGLTDVRDISPPAQSVRDRDPSGELWHYDQDACCALRKVGPLEAALAPFDGWISGRKRFQASTRSSLPLVEREGRRIKLNPLADWSSARVRDEIARRGLPMHPLVARGYPSIGCAVCTRSVTSSEDSRAGRWSGSAKVECGIHAMAEPA